MYCPSCWLIFDCEDAGFFIIGICILKITAGGNLHSFVAYGCLCDVVIFKSSNDNSEKEHRHSVAPDLFYCAFACNRSPIRIPGVWLCLHIVEQAFLT
jgi:hypothetical protein